MKHDDEYQQYNNLGAVANTSAKAVTMKTDKSIHY